MTRRVLAGDAKRCSEHVYRPGLWVPGLCSRPATVVRNGKSYCYQHDPEIVKPAKEARLQAQMQVDRARVQVSEARRKLLVVVLTTEAPLPSPVAAVLDELRAAESNLMGAQAFLDSLRPSRPT